MTSKEAVNWLINLTADIGKSEHHDLWHYEQALSEIKELLEGKDTDVARERYEDLCEYFNNNPHTIENILNDRKEFKEWLEWLRWHVLECDKLVRKLKALEGKDTNVPSRKGVFIPDITVEMFRNASLEGVEDLMASGVMEDISLPSAQPEQRYTEEELRVFQHGISLSLLSKRSSQHWQYDEDTATEIKFLERLYEKVVADMRGEQDG